MLREGLENTEGEICRQSLWRSFSSIMINCAQAGILLKRRGVAKKGKGFENVSEEELIFD